MENHEKKEHPLESVSFISRGQTWYVVFYPMKFQASFSLIRVNVSSSFQAISEENEGNSCVVWAMDVENLTMLNKVNLMVTLPFQARGRGWNVSMLVLNYGFILWSQFLLFLLDLGKSICQAIWLMCGSSKLQFPRGKFFAVWMLVEFGNLSLHNLEGFAGMLDQLDDGWPLAPLVCDSLVSSRPFSPSLCRLF